MYTLLESEIKDAAKIKTSSVAIITDILEDTFIIQIRDIDGMAWYYEGFYIKGRDYTDIYDEIIDSLKNYNICKEISARYKNEPEKMNLFKIAKDIDLAIREFVINLYKEKEGNGE